MLEEKNLESFRKKTLVVLEENFTHGVIDVDEYEKRIDIALNTSIEADLVRLTADLTVIPEEPSSDEQPERKEPSGTRVHAKEEDLIAGILSSINRKGEWSPARRNRIVSLMGSVRLDFTNVELPAGITEVDFFCVMGSLDVVVPDGVKVDVSGLPVMGSIDNRIKDPGIQNCPVLKIRGLALMGSVDIKPPRRRRRWKRW